MSKRTKKFVEEFKTKLIDKGIDVSEFEEYFKEIESNLKDKKYGLVWENHTEEIETELLTKFPILKEEKELRIHNTEEGLTNNFLIEGDNLESLTALKNMGKKVDVIYIDPPYNTGNRDFVYEDRYVDSEDGYRHSKWLSFMEKRLKLARDLMSEDGVIYISIDDNEQDNLKLLCDQIFGEENFVANLIWKKDKGTNRKNVGTLLVENEYLVTYAKDKRKMRRLEVPKKLPDSMANPDNDPRGEWFSGNISSPVTNKNSKNVYSVNLKGHIIERRWFRDKEDIEKLIGEDKVYVPIKRNGEVGTPRLKMFEDDFLEDTRIASNMLIDIEGATTTEGTNTLQELELDKWFDYPKPVDLIKHVVRMVQNKNATVLDFFAGSGTTGHAVLELNKEEGGNRNFILCTNNENNISRDVTYQRLNKVINGYTTPKGKEVEGIPSNLTYLKTELIEKEDDLIDFGVSEELLESMINNLKVLHRVTKEENLGENLVKLESEDRELYLYTNFYVESEDFQKVEESYKPKTIYVSEDNLNDINLNMFDEIRSLSELLVYK